MSASIAISAAATAQAAAATAAAEQAKTVACQGFVRGYQNDAATTQEMRQYAECVNRLHPNPIHGGELWALKAVVAAIFICTIFGLIRGYVGAGTYSRLEDTVMGGLVGFLIGLCGLLVLALVGAGIWVLAA